MLEKDKDLIVRLVVARSVPREDRDIYPNAVDLAVEHEYIR
jgi:hypothetical protein